jgi:hypothetical protein
VRVAVLPGGEGIELTLMPIVQPVSS